MCGERAAASVRVRGQWWQALGQPAGGDGRAASGAVVAGRPARWEDEGRPRRRGLAPNHTVVHDHDAPIEQLAHLDAEAGIGARAAELDEARAEAHGVVARDDARR